MQFIFYKDKNGQIYDYNNLKVLSQPKFFKEEEEDHYKHLVNKNHHTKSKKNKKTSLSSLFNRQTMKSKRLK